MITEMLHAWRHRTARSVREWDGISLTPHARRVTITAGARVAAINALAGAGSVPCAYRHRDWRRPVRLARDPHLMRNHRRTRTAA